MKKKTITAKEILRIPVPQKSSAARTISAEQKIWLCYLNPLPPNFMSQLAGGCRPRGDMMRDSTVVAGLSVSTGEDGV
jgi:hypothetical protein